MVLTGVLVVLAGCDLAQGTTPGGSSGEPTGSITATVANSVGASTIGSDLNTTVTEYAISLSGGPEGATQSATLTPPATSTTFTDLAPGSWTIAVDASNAEGLIVGSGSETVTVEAGFSTLATVTLDQTTGQGTLNLDLSWPTISVPSAEIVATLTPQTPGAASIDISSGITISATTNPATASFSGSYDDGTYMLDLQLIGTYDASRTVWRTVQVVDVRAGSVSAGNFALTDDDLSLATTGTISLTIDEGFIGPPPIITLTGTVGSKTVSESITITASSNVPVSPLLPNPFLFYVNGQEQPASTPDSIVIGPGGIDLGPGVYNVDVLLRRNLGVNFPVVASTGFRLTVTSD